MFVIKRNGDKESVRFDKITNRLQKLIDFDSVDPILITQKLTSRIYPGITTTELDTLASQICMSMVMDHPNFGILGARIAISNHQKNTKSNFLDVVKQLKDNRDVHNDLSPLINEEVYELAHKYEKEINDMIDMERDYLLDFFGFKTLEKSYLLKAGSVNEKKKIVERPQHLFMRVALAIHGNDLVNVKNVYDNLSLKRYTHATPTLFNAGLPYQQLSSCYLLGTEDSVEGIFETITDCAKISKWSGGIGVHISNIRANGSYIRKTAGYSDGILPMLKVYNDTARYINQGGGKRNGSFAMYLEPWHADVFDFLDAKKNIGSDEIRARDLFYSLWVPDLFMKQVESQGDWYLMCPNVCPGLPDAYGEEFETLYWNYVKEGKFIKKIQARDLWKAIISAQVELGIPYIGYKDHVNRKNNQNNIGTIKSSNLCVSGDTMIQIKKTLSTNISIKELVDKEVEVWNGLQWSKTIVRKTGENQNLLKITFSNSSEIKCTEYHKFYIQEDEKEIVYDAKNLKVGMYIIPYTRWSNDGKIKLTFRDIYVTKIEKCEQKEDTYCFNEPLEHKGIFNGIITGQCIEINEVSNSTETAVCNLASICLPSIIKTPSFINKDKNEEWLSLLNSDEKEIVNRIFDGKLKLFSKEDCVYCKLLKALLKDINLEYEEIDSVQAENYRLTSVPTPATENPFETVPQLFTIYEDKIFHIGGYDDTWKILKPRLSFKTLYDLSYELIINLNKVIDKNFYPTEKTRISNMRHRPTGLGVQGLADLFLNLKIPFDSDEARIINKHIFETMYFGAMNSSCDLAEKEGAYSTFSLNSGCPLSKGQFQFNLWGINDSELSGMWDWDTLRKKVVSVGVRNSLLIALMPTASTSQIMGSYVECFEPLSSNLYARRTLAGEFTVINPYLIKDLIDLELWNEDIRNRLQYDRGSVQNIKGLPKFLKDIYRTAYEIPQKSVITMSAERAPFVCQSQSLNLFFETPDFKKLTAAHFLGWKLGLKTGSYYIRSKPAITSQRFGMDISKEKEFKEEDEKECLNCGA